MNASDLKILYDKYWYKLFYHARDIVKDENVASDLISEVFISAWRKMPDDLDDNLAYLRKLTFRKSFSYLKFKKRETDKYKNYQYALSQGIYETDYVFDDVSALNKISDAANVLPSACKKIFELYLSGASTADICNRLGIGSQNALNQKQKAIRVIKNQLAIK